MPSTPDGLLDDLLQNTAEVNRVAARLNNTDYGVFAPSSLDRPRLHPAELGFIRVSSWLYVQYFEVGKVGVEFLASRFAAYGVDADARSVDHHRLVGKMRTFLQHNLNSLRQRDREIQITCETWLESHCSASLPVTEQEWALCLVAILEEATRFQSTLLLTVRSIEEDESVEQICKDWDFRLSRYHPPHEFDAVVSEVAFDMGRAHLDVERFRARHFDEWTRGLRLLEPEYDFRNEARKLIEQSLIAGSAPVLPITGKDIMAEFALTPGPEIGELLKEARRIFDDGPCSREELLRQLGKSRE